MLNIAYQVTANLQMHSELRFKLLIVKEKFNSCISHSVKQLGSIVNNLELGFSLRDEGTKLALANAGEEWREIAIALVLKYFNTVGEALFEDARAYAIECGIGNPPSPNAWGAVALAMSKRNLIARTGVFLPSKAAKSHGRFQPVWRSKESLF